jgi:hypothetical protein
VFTSDAVSVSADVLALAALALNQITGSSIYQAVAAVLIALVLIRLSLRLIQRSHDFLVGTWTEAAGGPEGRDAAGVTQPLRPAEVDKARAFLLGYPGVTAIRGLLFTFVGPGRIWIVARVDIDDGLRGAQVKSLVRGIESGLKHESENVYRVDVVPTGGAQAGNALGEVDLVSPAKRPQRAERHDDLHRYSHGSPRRPRRGHPQQQQRGRAGLRAPRAATPRQRAAPASYIRRSTGRAGPSTH